MVFLSSRDAQMDIVMAMNAGADDYITKPFSMAVLVAKVQALLRRVYAWSDLPAEFLSHGGLVVNQSDATARHQDKQVVLTRNEHKLLSHLLAQGGRVVSRDRLMELLWNDSVYVNDNTLTANMTRPEGQAGGDWFTRLHRNSERTGVLYSMSLSAYARAHRYSLVTALFMWMLVDAMVLASSALERGLPDFGYLNLLLAICFLIGNGVGWFRERQRFAPLREVLAKNQPLEGALPVGEGVYESLVRDTAAREHDTWEPRLRTLRGQMTELAGLHCAVDPRDKNPPVGDGSGFGGSGACRACGEGCIRAVWRHGFFGSRWR